MLRKIISLSISLIIIVTGLNKFIFTVFIKLLGL